MHLTEMVYTTFGQEKPSWYHPGPDAWLVVLEQEIQRIERTWQRFAFATVEQRERERYVQRYQETLLHCLKWLEKIEGEKIALRQTRAAIDRLLDLLLAHFEPELEKSAAMPEMQQVRLVAQLKAELPLLQRKLDDTKTALETKSLLIEVFGSFIREAPDKKYVYGQVLTMRSLMGVLLQGKLTEEFIFEQLCYFNCNSRIVYNFLKESYQKEHLTLPEKPHRYQRLSKYFKRMPVKNGSFLDPMRAGLTHQVSDYFADLAADAERQLRLKESEFSTPSGPQDRLALRLTIEQLGLYIRLLKEAEILQPVSTAQVIRFCIKYIRTVGKDPGKEMSYEYLKSSIGRQEVSIINVVEKQLNQMLVQLRKRRLEIRKTK